MATMQRLHVYLLRVQLELGCQLVVEIDLPNKLVVSDKGDINPGHKRPHHIHSQAENNMVYTLIGHL